MKYLIFLFCYFGIFLLPTFKTSDIVNSHWLYLSVLNIFSFFLFRKDILISFKSISSTRLFKIYSSFVFICLIHVFFSNNYNISLVDFTRIFNTFFASVVFFTLFKHFNENLLSTCSYLISLYLVFDLFFVYLPYIRFSLANSYSFLDLFLQNFSPNDLKGLNANKNITAAYIAFKIPFLLFLIYSVRNNFFKFILYAGFLLTAITVFLLQARAVYLSFGFSILVFLCFLFYVKKQVLNSILIITVLITSFLFSNVITSFNGKESVTNTFSSINFTDKSSNSRISLWQNAIESSYNNYFFGSGLGTWKVESLPYWNKRGDDFLVPYHAHNDFFELLTEVGIVGALFYLSIFLYMFYAFFLDFYKTRSITPIVLLSVLFVYFVDANLNFPLERTSMQIPFAFLVSLSLFYFSKYEAT